MKMEPKRRGRKKFPISEWEIQRRLERHRLYQVLEVLDYGNYYGEGATSAELKNLETLLRAGIRPSRWMMQHIGNPNNVFYTLTRADAREERDTSYRSEYSRTFYRVNP